MKSKSVLIVVVVLALVLAGLYLVLRGGPGIGTDPVNELLKKQAAVTKKPLPPSPTNPETGEALPAPVREAERSWGPNYSGIQVKKMIPKDIVYGEGQLVEKDSVVEILYSVWVYDPAAPKNRGIQIARSEGKPYKIKLGRGNLLEGWEMGLVGMRAGGKRELLIPGDLAYGEDGVKSKIPPNAIVLVETEVKSVR